MGFEPTTSCLEDSWAVALCTQGEISDTLRDVFGEFEP